MRYPDSFKEKVVRQLVDSGKSQKEVVDEFGISRSAAFNWVREHNKYGNAAMEQEKSPNDWSAEERLQAITEIDKLSEDELGKWCREKGLHTHHLTQWKKEALKGMSTKKNDSKDAEIRRLKEENKKLKKELRRKEKALAETSAILVLKKKAALLFGEEEDD